MTNKDIQFIAKAIKLPVEKAKILVEEETDRNLILDQICEKKFSEKMVNGVSSDLLTRLVVFKFSKNVPASLEEKAYVAGMVIRQLPKFDIKKFLDKKKKTFEEDLAQFYLVAIGFFQKTIKENNPDFSFKEYYSYMDTAFSRAGKSTLCANLKRWTDTLLVIKESKWF